jgi:hypothetical protein
MKIVRFIYNNDIYRFISLGQITSLLQACYFRGKELGYDRIFCDWYNRVTYPNWDDFGNFKGLLQKPKNGFLPINIIDKIDRTPNNVDKINISKGELVLLFNGNTQGAHYEYLNKYYKKNNEYPVFNIKKDNVEPYILFHYRESPQLRQKYRNTPVDKWIEIFEKTKLKYGKELKYYKIGEPSPIDNRFDIVFDYFPEDITQLYRLINNSNMLVCSPSGPLSISFAFGISSLIFNNPEFDKDYKEGKYNWVPKDKLNFVDI